MSLLTRRPATVTAKTSGRMPAALTSLHRSVRPTALVGWGRGAWWARPSVAPGLMMLGVARAFVFQVRLMKGTTSMLKNCELPHEFVFLVFAITRLAAASLSSLRFTPRESLQEERRPRSLCDGLAQRKTSGIRRLCHVNTMVPTQYQKTHTKKEKCFSHAPCILHAF